MAWAALVAMVVRSAELRGAGDQETIDQQFGVGMPTLDSR